MTTTIQVEETVRDALTRIKVHRRETYNDVIERLLEDQLQLNEETERDIKKGLRAVKAGRYKTHEEVGRELGF